MTEPLVPPDCNLRDFQFMPLDVVRLRDSDLAAVPDAEVFRAAVLSWCVAWHQEPASSLPDDDAVLAKLLGYGRDVKGWQKLRAAGALRGYVKCSNGRLYHPVVAEKALDAWAAKKAQRDRTEKARQARLSQRQSQVQSQTTSQSDGKSVTDNVTENVTSSVVNDTSRSKGQGQGQGQGQLSPSESGTARAAPARQKTRLSADWALPAEWRAWAAESRPDLNADAVAESFRDYWTSPDAKKPLKADWFRTWKEWLKGTEARGQFRAQVGVSAGPRAIDPPSRIAYRRAFAKWDEEGRTGEKPRLEQFAHLDEPAAASRETQAGDLLDMRARGDLR